MEAFLTHSEGVLATAAPVECHHWQRPWTLREWRLKDGNGGRSVLACKCLQLASATRGIGCILSLDI